MRRAVKSRGYPAITEELGRPVRQGRLLAGSGKEDRQQSLIPPTFNCSPRIGTYPTLLHSSAM